MNEQGYRMGIGASSVLLIFVVLCLTTLGVLSYASARASQALTDRRQTQVEAYFEASAAAQRAIAEIDAALKAGGEVPVPADIADFTAEDGTILFTVAAGETHQLEVLLRVGDGSGARYTVVRHQFDNIGEWNADLSWGDFAEP